MAFRPLKPETVERLAKKRVLDRAAYYQAKAKEVASAYAKVKSGVHPLSGKRLSGDERNLLLEIYDPAPYEMQAREWGSKAAGISATLGPPRRLTRRRM